MATETDYPGAIHLVEDNPSQVPAVSLADQVGAEAMALTPEGARYDRGFLRVAEAPFDDKACAVLAEPIDPQQVEVRPDGIVYLPWVWYADRLNRAFKPGAWSIVPRDKPTRIGDTVVYNGALYVLGRFVREAWGECEYRANNPTMSYASALEGAQSDCIVRCCKVLGVAKELWDPGWREPFLAAHVVKAWLPEEVVKRRDGKTFTRPAQWIFWRKDRETPWQVTKAQVAPQPAGTVKVPERTPGERVSAPAGTQRRAFEDLADDIDAGKLGPKASDTISEDQKRTLEGAITKCAKAAGVDPKGFRQEIKDRCGRVYGVEHFLDLKVPDYEQVMTGLRAAYAETLQKGKG